MDRDRLARLLQRVSAALLLLAIVVQVGISWGAPLLTRVFLPASYGDGVALVIGDRPEVRAQPRPRGDGGVPGDRPAEGQQAHRGRVVEGIGIIKGIVVPAFTEAGAKISRAGFPRI